jgi:hypothetical protein
VAEVTQEVAAAAGIPAEAAALIFQHHTAAAHLISPRARHLTLVEAARISRPARRAADLPSTRRFTVRRRQQRTML